MHQYIARWTTRDGKRGSGIVFAEHSCDVVLHVIRMVGDALRSVSVRPC